MPAAPSRRSPPSAAPIRSTRCATISIDDLGATRVLVTSISEDDIRTLVASPLALVGSDGNCVAPYGTVGKGMPHPRFYGTFPRVLSRYVREQSVLPLELAIHKMTGATARALKLKDRGLLREGFCADIVDFRSGRFRRSRHLRRSAPIPERRAHNASSSTARSWSRTPPTPARCRARCCGAIEGGVVSVIVRSARSRSRHDAMPARGCRSAAATLR